MYLSKRNCSSKSVDVQPGRPAPDRSALNTRQRERGNYEEIDDHSRNIRGNSELKRKSKGGDNIPKRRSKSRISLNSRKISIG